MTDTCLISLSAISLISDAVACTETGMLIVAQIPFEAQNPGIP